MGVQPVPSAPAPVENAVQLKNLAAVRFGHSVRDPHGSEQFFVSASEITMIGFWPEAQCVVVKWYNQTQIIPLSNVIYANMT